MQVGSGEAKEDRTRQIEQAISLLKGGTPGELTVEQRQGVALLTRFAEERCLVSCRHLGTFLYSFISEFHLGFLYLQQVFKLGAVKDTTMTLSCDDNIRHGLKHLIKQIIQQRDQYPLAHPRWEILNNLLTAIDFGSPNNWQTDIELLAALIENLPVISYKRPLNENLNPENIYRQLNFLINSIGGDNSLAKQIAKMIKKEEDAGTFDYKPAYSLIKSLAKIIQQSVHKTNSLTITITIDDNFKLDDILWLVKFIRPSCTKLNFEGVFSKQISVAGFTSLISSLPEHVADINFSEISLAHLEREEIVKVALLHSQRKTLGSQKVAISNEKEVKQTIQDSKQQAEQGESKGEMRLELVLTSATDYFLQRTAKPYKLVPASSDGSKTPQLTILDVKSEKEENYFLEPPSP